MQKVLIVYEAFLGKSIRFSNEITEVGKYPLSAEEVKLFQDTLREWCGLDDVNIVNVIPLREEEAICPPDRERQGMR